MTSIRFGIKESSERTTKDDLSCEQWIGYRATVTTATSRPDEIIKRFLAFINYLSVPLHNFLLRLSGALEARSHDTFSTAKPEELYTFSNSSFKQAVPGTTSKMSFPLRNETILIYRYKYISTRLQNQPSGHQVSWFCIVEFIL